MRGQTKWTVWLGAWLCAASVLTAGFFEAQEAGQSPSDARALLVGMGEFLGKTQQLSVTVRAAYDTVQASGQKVEWNEGRTLTVSRPGGLRVESERSNGTRSVVVLDGEEISTFDESGRVYAQAAQPGGVDETLVYFVRDLGMRLPLAVLFVSRAASELERRVRAVEYVERTGILGAPAHHLIGRTDTVNFQLWIAAGDQPVLQRIVLTYPSAPGQPQFRAHFSAWNLAPETADSLFTFTPPTDTNKIPFVATLPRYGAATSGASAQKGAKQ